VSCETLPWEGQLRSGLASRAEIRRHSGPYQAVIVPAIAERELALPSAVTAAADDASAEIARFDAEMGAEIVPFGSVLLRSESAASSQIENLTASARAIAEAEIGDGGRKNAAQIVANVRAMEAAVGLAEPIDADSILRMHRALMRDVDPGSAGRFRERQVWIGGGTLGPHNAMFVPPHHSRVGSAIADLVSFVRRDDLPVLAHAAIAHAQFETIHPFTDGNGRTGRALLHSMLRNKALTRNVTVPVSAGLLTDTPAYFAALNTYRAGDPTGIITKLSEAAFAAIANGRRLIGELRDVRASWNDRIHARRDSAAWRVADLMLRHPVINAQLISREAGIAAGNVHRYLGPLEDAGVLVEFTDRRRNRAWRSPEVLKALDEFAARTGRRL
jgi:Fic family protein